MIKNFQLKNGLKVIFKQSQKSPVVSIQMWVRTGSADEQRGQEGISHFIEHLVFKGTRKFKVGEIAAAVEGSGGELNAYTSFDQTVFYVTLSKHYIDTGLDVIAEMMGFPTFDPTEIDNEREVVIEEIKRGKDSLSRVASEVLFSNNYKTHPYGIPVIGYEENIRKLSPEKITKYYRSRYVPRNMFLVVTGDFDSKELKNKVEKIYGEFVDYKLKKIKRKNERPQKKPRIKVAHTQFEQSMAYLSWKIPNVKHKDVPALDLLAFILGQGDSSWLVQKLRIESAIVNSIGAGSFTPLDEGLFTISFSYNKENFSKALSEINKVIEKIKTIGFREDEIKKAVLNITSEEFYSLETVDGLSRKLGALEFYFKDLKAQDKYLKAIQAITPDQLVKIAQKYLSDKTLSVSVATNDNKMSVESKIKSWISDFSEKQAKKHKLKVSNKKIKHQKIKTNSQVQEKIQTEKIQLNNGVTLLLRLTKDTHVISAKAAFLGGNREEPQEFEGLAELLSRTWSTGTQSRSEAQIYNETESMAAGLSPIAGRNSIGLGLEVLNSFEKPALDLFLDVLTRPTFRDEVVAREKLVQLEQIRSRNDNPAQSCSRLFLRNIFSHHPYSRDMLGSPESLAKIHHHQIRSYWDQVARCQNLTMVVCGNFDKGFWLDKMEERLSSLGQGERLFNTYTNEKIENDIRVFEANKKEQTHIIYGFRGLSLLDEERYTLQVIQSILAGQGGRLFIELRDKNSLAYSVSPMRMEGLDTGYFGAYIGCSPEKGQKAIELIKQQFDLLMNETVAEQEIERAKKYIIGRHDIDLQRTGSVAASILYNDIYGIDYDEAFKCDAYYKQVTANDVLNLSQKIFSQKAVISVVGPQNPF